MKKLLSIILSLAMAITMLTAFGLTASAADISASDTLGNGTGDSNIAMNGSTIPAPTYTVTIPEKIEFGDVTKKLDNVSTKEAMAITADYTVSVNHSYLFDNQKNITVTLATDNIIKSGENEIQFLLYEKTTTEKTTTLSFITDTFLADGTTLFSVQPSTSLTNETESKTIYATLDQRVIRASGDYTGTVTFTVAMSDNV